MSLPQSHPDTHEHTGKSCPVTGATHEYCPPQQGDSRSVCPALNTMANHGYISRDGKKLTPSEIAGGLRNCYGLSTPLSIFLSYTTWVLLRRMSPIDLFEFGKHNAVEHDASLVHPNTPPGETFAPITIVPELVEELVADAQTVIESEVEVNGTKEVRKQTLLSAFDVGRARVRREKDSPLDAMHAEIARGEMAIILGVWEKTGQGKAGAPIEWIRRWLTEERLPEGWKPTQTVGLLDTVKRAKAIRAAADSIRKSE